MSIDFMPDWISNLEEEDLNFIKKFVVNSGSLKELAREYDVSYPTMRFRMDRLIEKIDLVDNRPEDPYISLIKNYILEGKIEFDLGKELINQYRRTREG